MGVAIKSEQTILLVEDDNDIRDVIHEALELEGYLVASVSDGRAALQRLTDAPPPKLILLDLMLPHVTGWEIIDILRNDSHPLSKVPILITSAAGASAVEASKKVEGHLKKPIDLAHLLEAVSRYCKPQVSLS